MNTILPLAIIAALGFFSSLLTQRWAVHKWSGIFIAAAIATVLWGAGCYTLFWLTAPNELGPPLPGPIFLTYLLALAAAAIPVGIGKLKTSLETGQVEETTQAH